MGVDGELQVVLQQSVTVERWEFCYTTHFVRLKLDINIQTNCIHTHPIQICNLSLEFFLSTKPTQAQIPET